MPELPGANFTHFLSIDLTTGPLVGQIDTANTVGTADAPPDPERGKPPPC